eukprot:sb/3471810/
MATALLSVYAKKAMSDHNMHYLKMLYFVSITSLFLTLPFLILMDGTNLLNYDYSAMGDPVAEIFPLISGIALTLKCVLQRRKPKDREQLGVSYSVANCMKRVFTIAASLVILRNPVSILNVLGMATALSGVALYNKVCCGMVVGRVLCSYYMFDCKHDLALYVFLVHLLNRRTRVRF